MEIQLTLTITEIQHQYNVTHSHYLFCTKGSFKMPAVTTVLLTNQLTCVLWGLFLI